MVLYCLQTDPLCFGGTDGSIEVTNVSGAAPITFELGQQRSNSDKWYFPECT